MTFQFLRFTFTFCCFYEETVQKNVDIKTNFLPSTLCSFTLWEGFIAWVLSSTQVFSQVGNLSGSSALFFTSGSQSTVAKSYQHFSSDQKKKKKGDAFVPFSDSYFCELYSLVMELSIRTLQNSKLRNIFHSMHTLPELSW